MLLPLLVGDSIYLFTSYLERNGFDIWHDPILKEVLNQLDVEDLSYLFSNKGEGLWMCESPFNIDS